MKKCGPFHMVLEEMNRGLVLENVSLSEGVKEVGGKEVDSECEKRSVFTFLKQSMV